MHQRLIILSIFTFLLTLSNNSLAGFNIPIMVKERTGVSRINEPVTCGIPFPKGLLSSDQAVSLSQLPLTQFKSLDNWNDGSVKWLLVDFQANIGANEEKTYYLTDGSGNTPNSKLKVIGSAKDITVITGPMKFIVSKEHFNLFDGVWVDKNNDGSFKDSEKIVEPNRLDNGIVISDCLIGGPQDGFYGNYPGTYSSSFLSPKKVEIEEQGPARVVIKIKGGYKKGDGNTLPEYIAYTVRIHAYSEKDYVKLIYTLENNGEYKNHSEYSVKEQWLYFDRLLMNSNLKLTSSKEISTDNYTGTYSNNDTFYLYQDHEIINETDESKNFFYTIKKNGTQVGNGSRTTGWIDINDGNFGVTVGIKYFWQNYDKAISFSNNNVSLELWTNEDYWPHNLAGKNAGNYQFEGGRHKTYEIFYRFYSGSKDLVKTQNLIKSFNTPLFALASSQWYADSKALGMIGPAGLTHDNPEINEALNRFEQLQRSKVHIEDSEWQGEVPPLTIYTQRENRSTTYVKYNIDWYGWFNFGDLPWAVGWSSLHYDWPYSMLLHFLRTQDYTFFDLGNEMIRHRYDIDQYHTRGNDPNSRWFNYWQRYEKGYHGNLDLWPNREYTPQSTHTWTGGLILYYLMTGDKKALDTTLENNEAIIARWRYIFGVESKNVEHDEIRDQGWCVLNLLNSYRVTGNQDYLNLATAIVNNSLLWMEVRRGKKGYWGEITNPDLQSMVMFNFVIEPLIEFHYETKDNNVKELLIRMAKWLKNNSLLGGKYNNEGNYMPFYSPYHWKKGDYDGVKGHIVYDFFYVNLFAYVYLLTNDYEYLDLARRVFRDATFYWQSSDGSGYISPNTRSKRSYHPRMYPGSESKIHGWTGRTCQVYLWTEYQQQKATQSTLTKIIINPDNVYLKVNTSCKFTAMGYDQYNKPIPNLIFAWQISRGIGTLSTTIGTSTIFSANTTPDSGSIIVIYGSISASADIIVTTGTPIAYPNPAKEKVTFTGLISNSKIKVFNLVGELVWEEKSLLGEDKYWELKNKKIASGIYIYVITNDKGDIITRGKLGIVK